MRKKVFSNIKRLSLVVCLFAISQVGHAQQESQATLNLDLTTALKIAHDNNPTIKIAELEIQRVDYAKKEALGNLLPSLSASGQYTNSIMKSVMFMPESFSAMMGGQKYMEIGYKNSYTGTVSAALPLVNFSLWEQIKSKQNEIDLILEQARASKIDMTKQVKDAYFAVLLAKNSLKVLERSINNAKETLKTTQTSFEQGVVSEYDLIRAKVQVNNLNPTYISAKNGLELAILQLKMILSLPQDQEIVFVENLEDFSDRIISVSAAESERAANNNSDIRQLDLNIVSLKHSLRMINSQHLPSLSAFGQYSYQTQADDFKFADYNWVGSAAVGLQLSIPIFNGRTVVNKAKQLKISLQELELQKQYASDGIELQIQSAINSMKAAQEQLLVNKDAINQAERGYEIAKVRYQTGTGTILELNDSELSMTQANLNYQQSLYDFLTAQTNLEKVLGRE
ncbi:MAG: TolC family protein [Bacteroidales bacterium]|jgi:outer membrane protein TolC|nr:TolC family protein [Bacteroidales bacterium]MBQ1192249.1 TolC family protein [Bacteroidales bacterium]MBQ2302805.1 TolC family protein [Bacteroidales bacterium]MBQ2386522.1 TolC family protein [Bacteroidales bacterium]MEE0894744.1 TolC family protein [Bacteroidales bacterium]